MLCFPDRKHHGHHHHLQVADPTLSCPPVTSIHTIKAKARGPFQAAIGATSMAKASGGTPIGTKGEADGRHKVPACSDVPLTLTLATAPQKQSIFPTWLPQAITFQHSNAQLQHSSMFQHSNAHLMYFCQVLKCPNTCVTVVCLFRQRLI